MASKKSEGVAGIDVGATGIKVGIVDVRKGRIISDRYKVGTPQPATPDAIAKAIITLGRKLKLKKGDLVGCGFPSIVIRGVTRSAANIDKKWIKFGAQKYLSRRTGYNVILLNDADAAGMAEYSFGKVKGRKGTVILLTIGTGIGSALFVDGKLVPNTELGHLRFHDGIAEDYASNRARKEKQLTYKVWGKELNAYLKHICHIFSPDLIILGGGVSKHFAIFGQFLDPGTVVVPAKLRNDAGIVGAALYAYQQQLLQKKK
ncbi:MAG TPA: ROK family protein [Saprospiraceae bacterium]|nr:ROK family protein [Saprospiraceae bacterium]